MGAVLLGMVPVTFDVALRVVGHAFVFLFAPIIAYVGIFVKGHTNNSTDHFSVIDAEDLKELIVSSQEVGRQARLCDLSHVLYREFEFIDFFADKIVWDIGLEEKCDLIL